MPELFAAVRAAALAAQPLADSPEVAALRAALHERRIAAASAASAAAAAASAAAAVGMTVDNAAEGGWSDAGYASGGGSGGAAKVAESRKTVCNDVTEWSMNQSSLGPRASPAQQAGNGNSLSPVALPPTQPLASGADSESFAAVSALGGCGKGGAIAASSESSRSDSPCMERNLVSIVRRAAGNSDGSGWRCAGGGSRGGQSEGQDLRAAVKLLREEVKGLGLEGSNGWLKDRGRDRDRDRDGRRAQGEA